MAVTQIFSAWKQIGFACSMLMLGAAVWGCSEPELPADVELAMADLPAKIDYNQHVKPILSDRCYACHGPDKNKQKADLRLDLPIAYEKEAESGRKALVPGNLAKSEVFHRIISSDPDYVMPTPDSHLTLTAEEKAILIRWIEDGAEYKPHWSLVAPEKPVAPEVKAKSWVKNPVDHFVLTKLEEKGLKPNPEAGKEALLRRVSLDLTGIAPTIQEVDAFLADKSPDAYEKVVDRLLKSPHYGERMAVDWLDLARYADTHGYQDDGLRNSYPWRDWVISAFNRNLPYDKFITWQLAGDLLPQAGKEQILATSFLRNHPQSQEGGIVDEEYRVEYVADRVNTFGKAFLAISTECARCHDHKYDPISQKNYFELFAFFNNNNESGQIPYTGEASPSLILTTPEAEKLLKFIRAKAKPLEEQVQHREAYEDTFEKWLGIAAKQPQQYSHSTRELTGHFTFDEKEPANKVNSPLAANLSGGEEENGPVAVAGKFGKAVQLDGDMSVDFNEHFTTDRNQPISISTWVNVLKPGEKGPLFSRTNGELDGWRGYVVDLNEDQTITIRFSHVFPDNAIHLQTKQKLAPKQWNHLVLTYDGSSKAKGIKLYINGSEAPLIVITDNLKQSIQFAINKTNWGIQSFKLGRAGNTTISHVAYDELKVYKRQLSELEIDQLSGKAGSIGTLLATPVTQLTAAQINQLLEYYLLAFDLEYAKAQQELIKVRGEENDLLTDQEKVMVYRERAKPRATFLLDRGVYDAPTERVQANTPENVLPFDESLPKNRLGLTKWLLSEKQPLFARVAVNRFWQQCFGQGIVRTSDDFGNQGDLPTHPELLDWLAVTFREKGWDVKDLLKTIVMSSTYRQASIPTKDNLAKDPDNLLFSRAPSYRMTSEMLRDNALAASGLLERKVGGKSVYPYQPAGVWEALAVRNAVTYEQGHGEDLYRRSIYTIWKRSSPHPAMINFDVPDRYACTVRRQNTSTPLQALVLMNDVQFVEAARVLGERMMREGGSTPEKRITYAFRALTSRHPREKEMDILLNLYQEEHADLRQDAARARQLLQEGEHPIDKTLNTVDLATCAVVASTLMNFDEFVFKR
jgi:cytochrome c553